MERIEIIYLKDSDEEYEEYRPIRRPVSPLTLARNSSDIGKLILSFLFDEKLFLANYQTKFDQLKKERDDYYEDNPILFNHFISVSRVYQDHLFDHSTLVNFYFSECLGRDGHAAEAYIKSFQGLRGILLENDTSFRINDVIRLANYYKQIKRIQFVLRRNYSDINQRRQLALYNYEVYEVNTFKLKVVDIQVENLKELYRSYLDLYNFNFLWKINEINQKKKN